MEIKNQPYNIRVKDRIIDPPAKIKDIMTIKRYEDCGYLRFYATIFVKRNIMIIQPLFEEHWERHFFLPVMAFNGSDGGDFIKYLETLWGLRENEFYDWFVMS